MVTAAAIARRIEELVLRAVEPAALELSLRSAERIEQDRERRHRHWRQTLERAESEANRARRQSDAVDPENRLVASELERQWEQKLAERQVFNALRHHRGRHQRSARTIARRSACSTPYGITEVGTADFWSGQWGPPQAFELAPIQRANPDLQNDDLHRTIVRTYLSQIQEDGDSPVA